MAEPDIGRIKGNIQSLLDKGSPLDDVKKYMDMEGVTSEQLRGMTAGEKLRDVGQSATTGAIELGAGVAGFPGDVQSLINRGAQKFGATPASNQLMFPTTAENLHNIGPLYQPKTPEGAAVRTGVQNLPAMAMGPGGVSRRLAFNVLAPTAGSEIAGEYFKGQPEEPYARVAGGLIGPTALGTAARAITPIPATTTRQGLANTLAGEGISPTAGQRTGSKILQYAESQLGDLPGAGGKATEATQRAGQQFERAAGQRAGINAERLTPEVIDDTFNRIGAGMDNMAARYPLPVDPQFAADVGRTVTDYNRLTQQPVRAINDYATEIRDVATQHGGIIPGDIYQSIRSRIEADARGMADPGTRHALRGLKNALDNGVERGIAASGNTGDLGQWQNLRREYRNLLPIAEASAKASRETGFTPAALENAVISMSPRGAIDYSRGRGDFAELVPAAKEVLKPLPQSGTAPRGVVFGIPAAIGAGAAHMFGGNTAETGIAAALSGSALPSLTGRVIMNPMMQGYLGNQLLAPALRGHPVSRATIAQALSAEPRLQVELNRDNQ